MVRLAVALIVLLLTPIWGTMLLLRTCWGIAEAVGKDLGSYLRTH